MTRHFTLLSAMLFVAVLGHSQCADPGNIYTFEFNNATYEVVKEYKTWAEAAACAVERGGKLVEINSLAEQEAVLDAILNGAGIADNYVAVDNGGGIA